MSKNPVLTNRAGVDFVVTVPNTDFEWIFPTFAQALEALRFISQPKVEEVFECSWLVQDGWTEDGEAFIAGCAAPAIGTNRGFECFAGHGHVNASVRFDEGWDYVDADEQAAIERGDWLPTFTPVPAGGAS